MFAIVEADMSTRLSAPRCSRSGDSGALVSENGTDAASLTAPSQSVLMTGALVVLGKRFPVDVNLPNSRTGAQDSAAAPLVSAPSAGAAACCPAARPRRAPGRRAAAAGRRRR